MHYIDHKAEQIKIAYIGGGSRGWAWGLMSDLASCDDISTNSADKRTLILEQTG